MEKILSLNEKRLIRDLRSLVEQSEDFVRARVDSISEAEAEGRRNRDPSVIGYAESARNALNVLSEEISKAKDNLKALEESKDVVGGSGHYKHRSKARTSLRLLLKKLEITRGALDPKEISNGTS